MITFEKPLSAPNGATVTFHAVTRAEVGPDADAITLYVSSWPTRQAWMEGHEPVAYAASRVEFAQLPTCSGFMADVLSVITGSGLLEGAVPTVDEPTEDQALERAAHLVRVQRNTLLAQCDWTQMPDSPLAAAKREAWAAYRQALRTLPDQDGFPLSVQWPVAPA